MSRDNRDKWLSLLRAAVVGALSGSALTLVIIRLSRRRTDGAERPSVAAANPRKARSKWATWDRAAAWIGVAAAVLALIQGYEQTPLVITEPSIASSSPAPLRPASGHEGIARPGRIDSNSEARAANRAAQSGARAAAHKLSNNAQIQAAFDQILSQ
jgi:hypothetical protein